MVKPHPEDQTYVLKHRVVHYTIITLELTTDGDQVEW